jgi:DNA modification methylase
MHLDLAKTLVADYSRQGALVLDPFAGCGTTLHAAVSLGRRAVGVEIERDHAEQARKHAIVFQGDALALPFADESVDLVVTSPPYGEAIGRSGDRAPDKTAANKARYEEQRFGRALTKHAVYGAHPKNIGAVPLKRRNAPCFLSMMPKAIEEMVRVLKPGAFAAVVVKDQRLGRRGSGVFDLPGAIVTWGQAAGAVFYGRRFGLIPASNWTLWQRVNQQRWGHPIPDVEHVVLLKKRETK